MGSACCWSCSRSSASLADDVAAVMADAKIRGAAPSRAEAMQKAGSSGVEEAQNGRKTQGILSQDLRCSLLVPILQLGVYENCETKGAPNESKLG